MVSTLFLPKLRSRSKVICTLLMGMVLVMALVDMFKIGFCWMALNILGSTGSMTED